MAAAGGGGEDVLAARELESMKNSPKLLAEHNKLCGGKVRTRFPPEPNGYLHIGHAKSMNMNFKMAFDKLGVPEDKRECYFRYDDTNPEKESMEYIDSIAEDVKWMGWKPTKVTFSSDYFGQLHELAVELIKRGKAYVCHQTGEEIEACRAVAKERVSARRAGKPLPKGQHLSPYRDRSVKENLKLFEDMRKGKYEEGAACLRMKMDMESENYNMWDQVAYRIKYVPHPHAGDGWCIYPTYDYTHCIIDSLEHIEYSICTLEFETRRESYYWLLEALDLYRPKVYEFARLNLTYTQLSKRKLLKLVKSGFMRAWNDPRMPTIKGLRRRGYTAQMLNAFCEDIGVTRNHTVVMVEKLEYHARRIMNDTAPRTLAVLRPIKLCITNMGDKDSRACEALLFPAEPERGSYPVQFTNSVWIDERDFRENPDAGYFGLTPGGVLGLRYAYPVVFKELVKDDSGNIKHINVEADFEKTHKPKTWVNWLSVKESKECEVRLYEHLYTASEVDGDLWEEQLNKSSEVVVSNARVLRSLGTPEVGAALQFEREGYFVVDQDSSKERLVFNRTVSLAESGWKKEEAAKSGAGAGKSRKEELQKSIEAKKKLMNTDPKDLFRSQTDLYSKFDDDGVPTHGADGAELSKSTRKKLKKEWDKQKKLFEKKDIPDNWK